MMTCEGYAMFHGSVKITPAIRPDGTRWKEPFFLTGVWFYKPDADTWYCKQDADGWVSSWSRDGLSDFMDDNGIPVEVTEAGYPM